MSFPEHLFVIGDIHGCLSKFLRLMDRIEPRPGKDQLVFLGDYIDRGEDSQGVLNKLLEVKEAYPETVFLMGNHEKMFLDFLSGADRLLFIYNGGDSTLRSYLAQGGWLQDGGNLALTDQLLERLIPAAHRSFLQQELRPYYETDTHIMVHAGLRHGIPLGEQSLDDLVWIREEFIFSEEDFGKPVVFGHTPFASPLVLPNKIGIDTGAVYGNTLTCLILPEQEFVSV